MKKVLFLLLATLIITSHAYADVYTVNLTWDAPTTNTDGSPLTDLSGYVVYYGPLSFDYTHMENVGNVTSFNWTVDVPPGSTQYFNVSAFDIGGNDSGFTEEVPFTFPLAPDLPPSTPSNLRVILQ